MTENGLDRARNIALTILQRFRSPTSQDLEQALAGAIAAAEALGDSVDREQLRRRLEADISVFVGDAKVLEDNDANHRPWLDARRAEIEWRFWDAYRDWSLRRMPPEVIRRLHHMTDDILGRLEDPRRDGPWDRRGMVVGRVQSGKTSNYTGLICKAADAGYNFIVVLTGLHNSLRSQTQGRLDEGFLGLDSRLSLTGSMTRAIGVGAGGRRHPAAYTLTSSDEKGDFAKGVASRVAGRMDGSSSPVLLVVKKHKTILHNLIEWVTTSNGQLDPGTGRLVVSRFALLVIDDEADNASVNTKKIEYERDAGGDLVETDPSEINKQIRRLVNAFDRSALVSYTATPFANIFIDEEKPSQLHGEDLFPRSFILRIPPPTNYLGPAEVFGVPAAEDSEGVERPGLPVLRTIQDHETWLATGHRSDAVAGPLPRSLSQAIRAFLLVCAARAARGQINVHNSMLVHVTRYVAVQVQVREQVQSELDSLKDRLTFGGGDRDGVIRELRLQWEEDFESTYELMPSELSGTPVSWTDVAAQLPAAAGRVTVLEINGSARDALSYTDHPDGMSVIAVGGDKLSRGLTLEGLSISYYLRASKMYDTLMQMGRWFGYRDGYNDLVRLYTTAELQDWYRDITVADEELGAKFDEMARVGSNPREFSLYVRKSSAGLLVTAHAKMRSGRSMDLTFSGDVVETIGFRRDTALQNENIATVDRFLRTQTSGGRRQAGQRHPMWRDVTGDDVVSMLEGFSTVDRAKKARGRLLAAYIRSRLPHSELQHWTVVLIDNSQVDARVEIGGEVVGLTTRSYSKAGREDSVFSQIEGDFMIRRLGDPGHEALDLSETERSRADELRQRAEEHDIERAAAQGLAPDKVRPPSLGPFVRKVRPVERGLLVLYVLNPAPADMPEPVSAIPAFLVSFPESPGAPTISYVVPRRYWEDEAA